MATFRRLFRIGCVLLSFGATFWPIHLFNLDEDLVEIDFKELQSSEDTPYPALTLCFHRPILPATKAFSDNRFRAGNKLQDGKNPRALQISDYISSIAIKHMNKEQDRLTTIEIKDKADDTFEQKQIFKNISLRRYQSTDCIHIRISSKENIGIHSIVAGIRKNVFKNKIAPTRSEITSGTSPLTIGLSFLGDLFLLPYPTPNELELNSLLHRACSGFAFYVRGMETLRRRNKRSSPCIDHAGQSSFEVLNYAANTLGCMPESWEILSNLPVCGNKKLKRSDDQLHALQTLSYKSIVKPCRTVRDVQMEYNSGDLFTSCTDDDETMYITAVYNNFPFKETTLVRAFTVWNLLSSISVIIGLFYGVSLIQLPDIIKKLKRIRKKAKNSDIKSKENLLLRNKLRLQIQTQPRDCCTKHLTEHGMNAQDNRNKVQMAANSEIQNLKSDISLLENHVTQLLEKKEYETVV